MKRKVVLIAISYIIGTIWGLYFNKNIIPFLCIVVLFYILISRKKLIKFIIIITIVSSGIISIIKDNYFKSIYENKKECVITGEVLRALESDSQNKILIKAHTINNKKAKYNIKLYAYIPNDEEISIGDSVKLHGVFLENNKIHNSGGFNYNKYLKSIQVCGEVKTKRAYVTDRLSRFSIKRIVINTRQNIIDTLYKYLPQKNANLCIALAIGEKNQMDDEIIQNFSDSGLSHILAISGMHVTYVALFIKVITSKFGKRKSYIIVICMLIFFCNLAYNSESVFRATIMLSLYYVAKLLHRKPDSLTSLSVSIIINLVINPFCIYNTSFIMSSLGTLGIIVFYKKFNKSIKVNLKNRALKYIKEQIELGISANLILIPIVATYYNKLTLVFILSSPIVNFVLSMVMIVLILFSICGFISWIIPTTIIKLLSKILLFLSNCLVYCADVFSKFNFLSFQIVTPSYLKIIIYYILVILLYIRLTANRKDKIVSKKLFKAVLAIYLVISIITKCCMALDCNMKIYFVDVGQGDCTFIITPRKHKILIDGGGSEAFEDTVGRNILLPYLLDKSVKNIDYIFVSHFDSDHVGGIIYIMQKLKVKNLVISKQPSNSENFQKFIKIAEEKKINLIIVNMGDRIIIERNLYFDILWPNSSDFISENSLNNNSLVCKLLFKNFSMLFTGDIEEIAERNIIRTYEDNKNILKANALKVGHHGSKTSSIQDFIELISPEIALVGVGRENKFGHPNYAVIQRLEKLGCKIYRTDRDGEVCITINRSGVLTKIKKYM